MSQVSIKKNFVYKSILTTSSYLVAFVTFPYVSRVLGVEKLGLVNFVDNTASYYLLFATMGINILGVREIAKVKTNINKRNAIYSSLLGLNILFTIFTLLIYMVCILMVPKFYQYKELFYIGTAKILFTAFIVEWFFSGIEDFKYISIRSIVVKCLYMASVFLFVKGKDDYMLYWILTVCVVIVNAMVNMLYIRRFVCFNFTECLKFDYVGQNVTLGIYTLMTSMYLTFNVMFLELISDNIQVGFYTTAHKLYMVILGFFSAFTQVMLPRLSHLVSEGEEFRFRELINRSFRLVFMLSIPLIACSMVLAPQIIYLLSGYGYEGAILPMRIIMPAVLSVAIAQVLAIQVLIPMKKDIVLLRASVIGAFVALVLNLIIVVRFESIGSAVVLVVSETVVTMFYLIYAIRHNLIHFPLRYFFQSVICALPSVMICILCKNLINNNIVTIIVALLAGGGCWIMLLYLGRMYKDL